MAEEKEAPPGQFPAPDISHPLILGFIFAAVPTMLLWALATPATLNLLWHSTLFQTFLLSCSGVLCILLGTLLFGEARSAQHPAILLMSAGFGGLALLTLVAAWLHDPLWLAWCDILTRGWALLFASAAVLFILWPRARRWGRDWMRRRPRACPAAVAAAFLLAVGGGLPLVRSVVPHLGSVARISRLALLNVVAVGIVTLLVFGLYLRRRTSVLFAFTLSLFIYTLAVAALALSLPWTLLWWYGHSLEFAALVLAADGILEGNRVRERDSLIAQLRALGQKLEEQSVRDPLTGSFNRRYALETLEAEFRKAQRARAPLTLLIADADDFKNVNDTYGHPYGDFVLCELVARLRGTMRATDVLARCGGEEFYVILPFTNRAGGQLLAQKLLHATRSRPFEHGAVSSRVTVSIGIADNLTPGVTDNTSLIAAADHALYAAKHAGKNQAVVHAPLHFVIPQTS